LDENALSFVQTFIQFSESTVQVGIVQYSARLVAYFYAARQTIKRKVRESAWLAFLKSGARQEECKMILLGEGERGLECFGDVDMKTET